MARFKLGNAVFAVAYFSWILFIMVSGYWNTILGLFRLATIDEYSYLLAVLLVLIFIAMEKFNNVKLCFKTGLQNIMITLLLISLSLYFYMLSWILEYTLELQVLSLIFMIWSLIALTVDLESLAKMKSIIALSFLLVPIPRIISDYMAAILSKCVAEMAAYITGAELIVRETVVLKTVGPEGEPIFFEVGPACSGIVSLMGFVAGLPLIINFVYSSKVTKRRKVMAVFTTSVMLLTLLFLSNLTRLSLIILSGKIWGLNTAMNIFHYTPSIILTVISVTATMLMLFKIIPKRKIQITKILKPTNKLSRSTSALLLLFLTAFALIIPELLEASTPYIPIKVSGQAIPAEEVLTNIENYVFNSTSFKILNARREKGIEVALNIPIVKLVTIKYNKYNNTILQAYIEGSDNPAQFHGWPVCLTYQKYSIDKYIVETFKGYNMDFQVVFIEASKGLSKILMAYIRLPIIVSYGGFEKQFYIRITAFTPITFKNAAIKHVILRKAIEDVITNLEPTFRETIIGKVVNVSHLIPALTLIVAMVNIGLVVYSKIAEKE